MQGTPVDCDGRSGAEGGKEGLHSPVCSLHCCIVHGLVSLVRMKGRPGRQGERESDDKGPMGRAYSGGVGSWENGAVLIGGVSRDFVIGLRASLLGDFYLAGATTMTAACPTSTAGSLTIIWPPRGFVLFLVVAFFRSACA